MSNPLEGVVAYVEVRSSDGKANYTDCVRQQLELLGAVVLSSITQRCTHVVFKNGKITTRLRANKSSATMVNVLWVEKCRELNEKVEESLYPVTDDPQDTPLTFRKTRSRFKSLQPSTLERDVARSEEKMKRKLRKDKKDRFEPWEYKLYNTDLPKPSKLVWPPDHSDVCCIQEIAEYKRLEDDMRSTASDSTECREVSEEVSEEETKDVPPSSSSSTNNVPSSIAKQSKPGAEPEGPSSTSKPLKNKEKRKLNNESYFDTALGIPLPIGGRPIKCPHVPSKKREVINTNTNAFVMKATSKTRQDKVGKSKNRPKNLVIDKNIERLLKHSADLIQDFKESSASTNPPRKVYSVPMKNNFIKVTESQSVESPITVESLDYGTSDRIATCESLDYGTSDSLSSYDASQHYAGLNKTVENVLETIVLSPQKRKPVQEISSDDSLDDILPSSPKRLDYSMISPKRLDCRMTCSQKEGMFNAFDFNEDEEDGTPMKRKQRNRSKTKMDYVIQHYPPIASRPTPLKISNRARRSSSKPFPGPPLNELEIINITQPSNVTKFTPSRRLSNITNDLDALFESVQMKNKVINKSLSQRKSLEHKSPMKSNLFDYHDIESPKKRHKNLTKTEDTICPSETMISLLSNELCEDVSVMEEIGEVTYESEEVRYEGDLDNSDVITKLQFNDLENNGDVLNQINSPTIEKTMKKKKKKITEDGVEVIRKIHKKKDTSDIDWTPNSCPTRSSGRIKNKSKVFYNNFSDEEIDMLPEVKTSVKKSSKRASHSICKTPMKIADLPELQIEIEGRDTLGLGKLGDEIPPESPTEIIEKVVNKMVEEIVVSENDITLSPVYDKCYDIITPISPLTYTPLNGVINCTVPPVVFHKNDSRSKNAVYPVLIDNSGNVQEPEISSTSDALIVIEDDPEPRVPDVASPEIAPIEVPQVSQVISLNSSLEVAIEPTSVVAIEPTSVVAIEPTSGVAVGQIFQVAVGQTSQGTGADTHEGPSAVVLQEKEENTIAPKKRRRKPKVEEENVFIRPRTSLRRSSASPKQITVVPETPLRKERQKKAPQPQTPLFFKKNTPPALPPPTLPPPTLPLTPETLLSTDTSNLSESSRRQSKRSKKVSTKFTSDQYVLNTPVNIFTSPDLSTTKPTCSRTANQSDSSTTKPTCDHTANQSDFSTTETTCNQTANNESFKSPPNSSNSKVESPPKGEEPTRRTGRSSKKYEESEISKMVETCGIKNITETKKNRKSLEEFDLGKVRRTSKDGSSKKRPMYIICTTSMHRDDQMLVVSTVRSLDTQYVLGAEITKDTTHLIVGSPRRTINLLKAIVWGCWIVKLDWVTESISNSKWLREDKYVINEEFPVLKYSRQRLKSRAAKLFSNVGMVYVERDTKPPRKDLVDLIVACGGQISMSKSRSDVCVGGAAPDRSHSSVTELWVLDSISLLKVQKKTEYSLYPYHSPSPEF